MTAESDLRQAHLPYIEKVAAAMKAAGLNVDESGPMDRTDEYRAAVITIKRGGDSPVCAVWDERHGWCAGYEEGSLINWVEYWDGPFTDWPENVAGAVAAFIAGDKGGHWNSAHFSPPAERDADEPDPEFEAELAEYAEKPAAAQVPERMVFDITMMQGTAIAHEASVSAASAILYILGCLPDDAYTLAFDGDPKTSEVAVIRIDWAKVPPEIRQGAAR